MDPWQNRGGDPTPPDRLGEPGIGQERSSPLTGRAEFRHDAIPIRDENGLSAARKANVFT
jgi:hypothetical protein